MKIFDYHTCGKTKILGTAALTMLAIGVFNIVRDGAPTMSLLVYRGGIVLIALGLLYVAAQMADGSDSDT